MQAIPNYPAAGYIVNVPNLVYSIAFSVPSCFHPSGNRCGANQYDYNLYKCGIGNPCGSNSIFLTLHSSGLICNIIQAQDLEFCDDAQYYCFVAGINGGNTPPTDHAFIEWFYICTDLETNKPAISGKFTWVATSDWLLNAWQNNGNSYVGSFGGVPYPLGLPLFNTANHTPV
jgi:hypothetical protein